MLIPISAGSLRSAGPQVRTAEGRQENVRVPSVSEPWSATAGRVPQNQEPLRWPMGHYPGYRDAKRVANERRRARTTPPSGTSTFLSSPLSGEAATSGEQHLPEVSTSSSVVFDGPGEFDTNEIPPDSQIAAGPTDVVVAINSLLAIYDKSGNVQGSFQNLSSFFSSLGITGEIFDPRLVYDQADQRFILSAAEVDFTSLSNGHVLLAVSASNNPLGTWYKFAINFEGRSLNNTANTFPDFPGLGLSSSAVYITTNQFALTSSCITTDAEQCYFSDAWIKVIGLPELLAGNTALNITTFKNIQTAGAFPAFGIQPALTYGPSPTEYLVAADFSGSSNNVLDVFTINISGTPALSATSVTIPNSYALPPDAYQPNTGVNIATNDFRPLNAVWINDNLWCAQNTADSQGGNPVIQWFDLSATDPSSLSLAGSGTITGFGDAYYPAVSVDSAGSAVFSFTTSSGTQYASAAFTGRDASSTPGATGTPIVYKRGTDDYADVDVRWGDYSGISLDPGGTGFWMIAEYAGSPNPHFGTAITLASGPPALSIAPTSFNFPDTNMGSTSGAQTFTVTNLSANPVTIVSVTMGGADPGNFGIPSDTCAAATLAAAATCSLSANFTPGFQGENTALITIISASSGGPSFAQFIPLSGYGGSSSSLAVSPTGLTFPDTALRTSSAPQTVTLKNTGSTPINILSPFVPDGFTWTTNCIPAGTSSGNLAAGASCEFTVTFRPIELGTANQLLQLNNDTVTPNVSVTLTGNGTTAPAVTLCPVNVNFGNQTVGTASAAQAISISNTGSSDLVISAIGTTGDFASTNSCGTLPATIPARTACLATVTFTPTATGVRTGTLTITDSATGSPHVAQLSGNGVAATAMLNKDPLWMHLLKGGRALPIIRAGDLALHYLPDLTRPFGPSPMGWKKPSEVHTGQNIPPVAATKVQRYSASQPLRFELNRGQINERRVRFMSRGDGYALYLMPEEAVLALRSPATGDQHPKAHDAVVKMKLVDANPDAPGIGLEELPGKANYFLGADPTRWRKDVEAFAKVRFEGVYPGVDLVYYGRERALEYDLVIAPGFDPSALRIRFEGATRLRIDSESGDLVVDTRAGALRLHKPAMYTFAHRADRPPAIDDRRSVEGSYTLAAADEIRFNVGPYDRTQSLVIDPAVSYSTYFGGSYYDQINAVALDAAGNIYLTGQTGSSDFPIENAFQGGIPGTLGNFTAFVTKFAPDGKTLIYSTYLGGTSESNGTGIAVDSLGSVYVTGYTASTDFPLMNPIQTKPGGGQYDAFVTQFAPSGSALVFSTYLGGSATDTASAIAVDPNGNVYITGMTGSPDFPHTAGVFQPALGSMGPCNVTTPCSNAFVTKINSTGTAYVYSSFLGGSRNDSGSGIAADSAGAAYVTGTTNSTNFPITPGAYQTGYGGFGDAFVTKVSPDGLSLIYSTFLGGGPNPTISSGGVEQGAGIAVDSTGSAYVGGMTNSGDFPHTSIIPPFTQYVGFYGFIAKLRPAGCALTYSTMLGGFIYAGGLALDPAGNATLAGETQGGGAPVVNPVQNDVLPQFRFGYNNAYLAEVDPGGSNVLISSYLGGTSGEYTRGVAADSAGNIYVVGQTFSSDYPTMGGFQLTKPGSGSGFLTKITPGNAAAIVLTPAGFNFPPQTVGFASNPASLLLRNMGSAPLNATLSVTGDFTETDDCASVAGGGYCTVNVTFKPTVAGDRSSAITITSNATYGATQIPIAATGVNAPYVSFSPTTLNFGNVPEGTTSAPMITTLSNIGNAPLVIASVSTGDPMFSEWAQTNNCPASLPPGSSCTFSVTYSPPGPFSEGGILTVSDNALDSPQSVTLSGQGTGPQLFPLPPSPWNFGSLTPGSSEAFSQQMSNSGNQALVISSISVTGPYQQTFSCGLNTQIAPFTYCNLVVTFSPTALGPANGTLTITYNAPGSPFQGILQGTGVASGVSISASSLQFPGTPLGTQSSPSSFYVSNTQNAPLTLKSVALSGDFVYSNGNVCSGFTIQPYSGCSVGIQYAPKTAGPETGSAVVTEADGTAHTVTLSGTGQDFMLATAPGTSASATVIAGQTATYNVTVTPVSGMASLVAITCTVPLNHMTCASSPQTVSLDGTHAAPATIQVTTTASSLSPPAPHWWPLRWWPATLGALLLSLAFFSWKTRRQNAWIALSAILLLMLLWGSCGGGGAGPTGGGTGGGTAGTTPGVYTVTVTASYSSNPIALNHSMNLTLSVK